MIEMTKTLENILAMRSKESNERIHNLAKCMTLIAIPANQEKLDCEKTKRAFRRTQLNFVVGDWVVFEGKIYEVKYVYCSERIRITDGFQGMTVIDYMDHLRHATEEEYENRFANI